jgi:hypothetical protein
MGSYPWGIRANAYQTLNEIKPDLSNLNDVLKAENLTEMKAAYVATRNSFRDYFKGLDEAAKAVCNGGEDVVKKCLEGGFSLTDPAIRLCSIVKGQMSLNQGGVANMMVSEVMSRTMTQHDQLFSSVVKNIVRPSSGDTGVMNKLIHACNRYTYEGDDTGGQGCGYSRRHYLATVGSCLGKGTLYRAWADWHVDEGSSYTCRREGGRKSRVELSSGNVVTDTGFSGGAWISFGLSPLAGLAGVFGASATNAIFSSDIVGPGAPQFAAQNGFAGGIEYLIRKEICGQTLRNLPSAACDSSENGIPDKPSDMSW